MLISTQPRGVLWLGGILMSLPADGEAILRLKPADAVGHEGGGARSPRVEEQVLVLFDELREPLLRYLLSLRLAAHRSEEILQDVFLKLFEHLKSGRPDTNLRGWLFRVAHNLALQDLRRRHEALAVASVLDLCSATLEDPHPDPEQELIFDERESRLLAALDRLPETEQRCLHLRAEGLRYREISEVLHIGVSTVADRLRRAIDTIRKELHG